MSEFAYRTVPITGIGAFELKHCYQKHLFRGSLVSSLFSLTLIGAIKLHGVFWERELATRHHPMQDTVIVDMTRIVSLTTTPPRVRLHTPRLASPAIGTPLPVPDDLIAEDVVFATQSALANLRAPQEGPVGQAGVGGDSILTVGPDVDPFPPPEAFIPVDEMPVQVHEEKPTYPPLAERAGIEGTVWVQVLIDREGRVRQAIIQQPSGTDAGFEEAVLEAADKNRFKPAIQNGRPVPVWVSYKVVFKLK